MPKPALCFRIEEKIRRICTDGMWKKVKMKKTKKKGEKNDQKLC